MLWYKQLYVGEKAKNHRFRIIQNIRRNKPQPGAYVITPASNGNNILDIYSTVTLLQAYYRESDMMILGIADGYDEAMEVAGIIVHEMYQKTGEFNLSRFLEEK